MTERVDKIICVLTELLLIVLVVGAPWAFGSVHAPAELIVTFFVAGILLLWACRMVLNMSFDLSEDTRLNAVFIGLFGLFLVAAFQAVKLPKSVLQLISPETLRWVGQIEPARREVVFANQLSILPVDASWSAGSSISLNPRGSFEFALQMVTLAALFAAIGSLRSPVAVLRRIAVACTIAGGALSFFAIAQQIGSPPNRIYWFFESAGAHFGPFISKNHYPYYVNVAIALAVGLLLEQTDKANSLRSRPFLNVRALWLLFAITLMVASVVLSLSRGGLISLTFAFGVGIVVRYRRGDYRRLSTLVVAICTCVLAFVFWIGTDFFADRLGTLAEVDTYQGDGRWTEWRAALLAAAEFPIFGAGAETYRHWELIFRPFTAPSGALRFAHRAENEFLDVLCEFGLCGLLMLLLVTGGALFRGLQVGARQSLGIGALMAMVAIIAHSIVDFGLRVPANTIIAIAVAALLCSLPRRASRSEAELGQSQHDSLAEPERQVKPAKFSQGRAWQGVGSLVAACTVMILSYVILQQKWQSAAADSWRTEGYRALVRGDLLDSVQSMHASTLSMPGHALNHIEAARIILDASYATDDVGQEEEWVRLALYHCIQARDFCPLAWKPQFWLARNANFLRQGDSRIAYLENARLLNPTHPKISLTLGDDLLKLGNTAGACRQYRDSLRVTNMYLGSILLSLSGILTADEIIEKILPDDPALALEAAQLSKVQSARETYLKYALELIDAQSNSMVSGDLKATIYEMMGRADDAVDTLRTAIRMDPDATLLRIKLANILLDLGRLEEAERELRLLSVYESNNPTVEQLSRRLESLRRVSREGTSSE